MARYLRSKYLSEGPANVTPTLRKVLIWSLWRISCWLVCVPRDLAALPRRSIYLDV